VYRVKTPTFMAASPDYKVIVSTTPMNNTMKSLPRNYTLISGPFQVQTNHFVLVINYKNSMTQF